MPHNRITQLFKELRGARKKALIGYLTAGDPDLTASERHIRCALDSGLDILELGVPFSDPIADGPVIQAASQRALEAGTTLERVLGLVKRLRKDYHHPILLFGYANPFLAYGYERLCRDASEAGADGMLIVDLAYEEADEIRDSMGRHGLVMISLLAPTTPLERARAILRKAEGFVYYIMVKGVTGARDRLAADLESHIAMIRRATALPVAAGFGISSGDQARRVAHLVDGVVVGSALIEAAGAKRSGAKRLQDLIKELRTAIDLSSE